MNALPGLCLSSSSSSSSSSLKPPYLSSSSSYSSSFARTLDIRFLLAFKNATLFPPLSPFVPFSLPPSLPSSLPPSCPPSLRRTLHRPLSCFLYLPSSPLLLFQRCFLSLLFLPLSQGAQVSQTLMRVHLGDVHGGLVSSVSTYYAYGRVRMGRMRINTLRPVFALPPPPVARVATELSVNSALKAELRPEATRAKAQVEAARAKKTRGVEEEMEAVMRQTPAKSTQGNRDWPALYPKEARIQRNTQNATGTKGSAKEGEAPFHPLYFSLPLSRHFGRTQSAEANSWHEHTGSGPSVQDSSDTKVPSTECPQRDRREGRTQVRAPRTPSGSFRSVSLFFLYLLLYS